MSQISSLEREPPPSTDTADGPENVGTAARIVEAAHQLLTTGGVNGFSLRGVAKRAHVRLASVQYHFPSLKALAEGVIALNRDRYRRAYEQVSGPAGTPPRDQPRAVIAFNLEDIQSTETRRFFVHFWSLLESIDGYSGDLLATLYEPQFDMLAALISSVHPKLDPAEARARAQLVGGLIEGMFITVPPVEAGTAAGALSRERALDLCLAMLTAAAERKGFSMTKPFASTADTVEKRETLEVVADGVFALTAEGDPNVGAVEGDDFLVCIEARATPVAAREWLEKLREHTDKPIKYLALTHYHAVRVLGASAFDVQAIIAHSATQALIEERGIEDWASEFGRMPRLFKDPDSIPGLTRPDRTFDDHLRIDLGGDYGSLDLQYCGRGHTAGDIVVWHQKSGTLFGGDLVEAQAALYTGDAFHFDWSGSTLDRVKSFGADNLVGGRGPVARGRGTCEAAIEQTREFLRAMIRTVGDVHRGGGTLKEAFESAYAELAPKFGHWPIFEHCMPFNVQRLWDEFDGIDWPRIWTMERDREVWAQLQN